MHRSRATDWERFESKVARRGNGCHEWIGGYGQYQCPCFCVGGRSRSARRLLWEQLHGPIDMKNERNITTRRLIQQTKHCVEEALSVVEAEDAREDIRCAIDDLEQAQLLIEKILPDLRNRARSQ